MQELTLIYWRTHERAYERKLLNCACLIMQTINNKRNVNEAHYMDIKLSLQREGTRNFIFWAHLCACMGRIWDLVHLKWFACY